MPFRSSATRPPARLTSMRIETYGYSCRPTSTMSWLRWPTSSWVRGASLPMLAVAVWWHWPAWAPRARLRTWSIWSAPVPTRSWSAATSDCAKTMRRSMLVSSAIWWPSAGPRPFCTARPPLVVSWRPVWPYACRRALRPTVRCFRWMRRRACCSRPARRLAAT